MDLAAARDITNRKTKQSNITVGECRGNAARSAPTVEAVDIDRRVRELESKTMIPK
jgi:hypothetical protein